MVADPEVPLGTAEPVLFQDASVIPKGTQCLDHPIFPALKRRAIFEHEDAKYEPLTPRVFKLSHCCPFKASASCSSMTGRLPDPTALASSAASPSDARSQPSSSLFSLRG